MRVCLCVHVRDCAPVRAFPCWLQDDSSPKNKSDKKCFGRRLRLSKLCHAGRQQVCPPQPPSSWYQTLGRSKQHSKAILSKQNETGSRAWKLNQASALLMNLSYRRTLLVQRLQQLEHTRTHAHTRTRHIAFPLPEFPPQMPPDVLL